MSSISAGPAFSELYMAYAAGCLDPAFSLLVETQASLRSDVMEAICISEVIAAAHLEMDRPSELSAGALDRALAAIDQIELGDGAARRAASLAGEAMEELLSLPEPLRETALIASGEKGWRFSAPGIRRLALPVSREVECELIRLDAGTRVPRHSHEGAELTLCVQGHFSDETGRYAPGDLSVKGPNDTHTPQADESAPAIVLAVRDGGLRFSGLLGAIQRIMN